MNKKIGIMGGTFNPIHIGHLLAASSALETFELDEVMFIPNNIPPHRRNEEFLVSGELRYQMVSLAIESNPQFSVSREEIDRKEVSFTSDTVTRLKEKMPDVDFTFITGMDSLMKNKWYKLDNLLEMLERFVAVTRPGFSPGEFEAARKELCLENDNKISMMEMPAVGVSSTMIRERIRSGKSVRYMIPEKVESFILEHHLYK
ncbi:MAG: nicotinate-nucleotide adenylyltransferase [Firmicutes bacterium]|nr:nicotinate-nucleotide adenylyltransferase [Bacillota bacterium]